MKDSQTLGLCPVCSEGFGDEQYRRLPYPKDSRSNHKAKKPQSIIFCNSCGLGIAEPGLTDDELSGIYFDGYYPKDTKAVISAKKNPGHFALAKARWDFIREFVREDRVSRPFSILDIGAGHGFLGALAAKDKALALENYCVVEKDRVLRGALEKTWQKNFSNVKFAAEDSLDKVKGKYELSILSHILEHLNNPKLILKAVSSKLAEGGLIFIDVPNQDYLFKQDVFPHVLFFNEFGLEFLIKGSGLALKYIGSYGHDRNLSPMNYKNKKRLSMAAGNLLYKARRILPQSFCVSFFSWQLGVNKKGPQGTWLRAVVQKG